MIRYDTIQIHCKFTLKSISHHSQCRQTFSHRFNVQLHRRAGLMNCYDRYVMLWYGTIGNNRIRYNMIHYDTLQLYCEFRLKLVLLPQAALLEMSTHRLDIELHRRAAGLNNCYDTIQYNMIQYDTIRYDTTLLLFILHTGWTYTYSSKHIKPS